MVKLSIGEWQGPDPSMERSKLFLLSNVDQDFELQFHFNLQRKCKIV